MKDLSVDFMPDNPSVGDSLLITATDAVTGEPVGYLSVVLLNDGMTIDNSYTDSNGQTSFILPEGELLIRASGGMYNAAEFMITVTPDGTVIEESLDFDNDGISNEFDTDDDNDGVLDTDDQCPNTPIGAIVESDGCPSPDLDSDGDGVMDDEDICPNTSQGATVDSGGCAESQLDVDSDLDGVEDGADLCPDTPTGVDTNSVGCSESQLDTANEEDPDDENDDEIVSESSEGFLGMDMLTLGGIGGGVLVLAILSLLFVRRGGGNSNIEWKYEEEDIMFESQTSSMMNDSTAPVEYVTPAPVQSGPPRTPPPGHQGYMSDGYEVTEYPDGSGSWWWKDPEIDSWKEWS
jgi:hypothetical protein